MKLQAISVLNRKAGFVYLVSLIAALCFSCAKKDPPAGTQPIPPVTTVGANSFGTFIDEQLWVPRGESIDGQPNVCVSYANGDLSFSIYCDRGVEEGVGQNQFVFHRSGITGTGDYDLSDPNKASVAVITEDLDSSADSFTVISGTLTILKLDLVNHIISGQFSCLVKNTTTDITHDVQSGRFDLQIGYCQ